MQAMLRIDIGVRYSLVLDTLQMLLAFDRYGIEGIWYVNMFTPRGE